ncbi:hypothetical protein KAW80_01980 [Candidatus Babeliales bacterium]|nr:hypothetical protein [Candidatus Babeliales bacterium]
MKKMIICLVFGTVASLCPINTNVGSESNINVNLQQYEEGDDSKLWNSIREEMSSSKCPFEKEKINSVKRVLNKAGINSNEVAITTCTKLNIYSREMGFVRKEDFLFLGIDLDWFRNASKKEIEFITAWTVIAKFRKVDDKVSNAVFNLLSVSGFISSYSVFLISLGTAIQYFGMKDIQGINVRARKDYLNRLAKSESKEDVDYYSERVEKYGAEVREAQDILDAPTWREFMTRSVGTGYRKAFDISAGVAAGSILLLSLKSFLVNIHKRIDFEAAKLLGTTEGAIEYLERGLEEKKQYLNEKNCDVFDGLRKLFITKSGTDLLDFSLALSPRIKALKKLELPQ